MAPKREAKSPSSKPIRSSKMNMLLRWELEGEVQLSRRLRGIGDQLKDWRPAFRRATNELKSTFSNDVFQTQGTAVGAKKWAPLKPQYLAQKRKRGFSGGTLVATGQMKNSFQTIVKSDLGAVWNSIYYFKYHQSNRPRRKLPRRIIMRLGNNQRQLIIRIFQETFFQKVLKR